MTRNRKLVDGFLASVNVVRAVGLLLTAWVLVLPTVAAADQVSVRLVSARNHIEGGMTAAHSVYADETRIYLATVQGTLFVLARDRAANFPLLESIHYTSPLFAVRGDRQYLYVAAADGKLLVYRKGPQLALVQTVPVAAQWLQALTVTDDSVFVGVGQTRFALNDRHVFLSATTEGDTVVELSKPTMTPVRIYGEVVEENKTVVFDRQTGARLGATSSGFGNLYAAEALVIGTVPGCCGPGIFLHSADTLSLDQFIGRAWTNTVVQRGGLLIAGNEAGTVDIFGLRQNPSPLLATLNLPQTTGHTGPEEIEIRALWADQFDNLIFAGSSWGNDQARGPLLPSFFVLEVEGEGEALSPHASLSSTRLSFGIQSVDTTSAAQTVTLTNTGTAPLSIIGLAMPSAEFPVKQYLWR